MLTKIEKYERRVERRNSLHSSRRPHVIAPRPIKRLDRPFDMSRYEAGADVTKAKRKRFELSQMPGVAWSWLTAWKNKAKASLVTGTGK